MYISRRHLLQQGAAYSAGFLGLQALLRSGSEPAAAAAALPARRFIDGYGPLVADPAGCFDLPLGFSYHIISPAGATMTDGLCVPGLPDGMAAFPGPRGLTILIRNHEIKYDWIRHSPFGPVRDDASLSIEPDLLYDRGFGTTPGLGGTTTLVYDTHKRELISHSLSLVGTMLNCAGGPTPWNTWISCEETEQLADDEFCEVDHGYNFEVPATTDIGLVKPVPLKAMGRFKHEAVAVDPRTGIIYQTEDQHEGLLYRFIPSQPGELHLGGSLQMLALRDVRSADTRNWPNDLGVIAHQIAVGSSFRVDWIDVEDIESPNNDMRFRGFDAGAARFARGEGMWWAGSSTYFACTNGGPAKIGQIWRYTPSPHEGSPNESTSPGVLELFLESGDSELLRNCDNLTSAPWGDLLVCEDGGGRDRIVGITPAGECYTFGSNAASDAELAGACFSPDGSTLFVNIQQDGLTLAITGPFHKRTPEI
ncbi:MAG: alkaline phosphatase PhoX [Phycisphaerales bacterium]